MNDKTLSLFIYLWFFISHKDEIKMYRSRWEVKGSFIILAWWKWQGNMSQRKILLFLFICMRLNRISWSMQNTSKYEEQVNVGVVPWKILNNLWVLNSKSISTIIQILLKTFRFSWVQIRLRNGPGNTILRFYYKTE